MISSHPFLLLSQVTSANAFAQTLRRYTSLNHLAQAARAVLQNTAQINQMLSDLNRVDFANVQVGLVSKYCALAAFISPHMHFSVCGLIPHWIWCCAYATVSAVACGFNQVSCVIFSVAMTILSFLQVSYPGYAKQALMLFSETEQMGKQTQNPEPDSKLVSSLNAICQIMHFFTQRL